VALTPWHLSRAAPDRWRRRRHAGRSGPLNLTHVLRLFRRVMQRGKECEGAKNAEFVSLPPWRPWRSWRFE
jgi:hypothetical protein